MPEEKWIEWRPKYAPHVIGRYTERQIDPETHQPIEQRYSVECEKCGDKWGPTHCTSGLVRSKIANFATVHAHRNAFNEPFPKSGG